MISRTLPATSLATGGAIPCLILPDREKKFFYDTSFGIKCREFGMICGIKRGRRLSGAITVVSGSQNDRIASHFRDAGFQNVHTFGGGYFEDWVGAEASRNK